MLQKLVVISLKNSRNRKNRYFQQLLSPAANTFSYGKGWGPFSALQTAVIKATKIEERRPSDWRLFLKKKFSLYFFSSKSLIFSAKSHTALRENNGYCVGNNNYVEIVAHEKDEARATLSCVNFSSFFQTHQLELSLSLVLLRASPSISLFLLQFAQ